jgi:hypothetical protein
VLRTAVAWERVGLRWAQHFAGVLLMVAEKQIYVGPLEPALVKRRAPAYLPVPRALAAAERVRKNVRARPRLAAGGRARTALAR